MTHFRIQGQQPLSGTIGIQGSKNAATPLLVASLLSPHPCTLTNVPNIEDVQRIIELLSSVGATVTRDDLHTLTIEARSVDPAKLAWPVVRRLRSSVLLMGALLGRCRRVRMPGPGGDQIGARPLAAHVDAFRLLGVEVTQTGDTYELVQHDRGDVVLAMSEFSVTATENVVLAAVLAEGKRTVINCAAAEPSVQELCWLLQQRGAKVAGIGTHTLTIDGVSQLTPLKSYAVMPDPVESGTFIALAAAARAELVLTDVPTTFMAAALQKFSEANVHFEITKLHPSINQAYLVADVRVRRSTELTALRNVHNMPYPGIAADLLPAFTVMLTQAHGTSLVHDWMYEGRQKYAEELRKMGGQIFVADPHRLLVTGPTNLFGAEIASYDIRAGAALFVAALIAQGTSVIGPAYQVDRGYEQLDQRLAALGANIQRVEEAD